MQPFPLPKTNLCCAITIRNNSLALLHAICFTAAAHEAVTRGALANSGNLLQDSFNYPLGDAFHHKAISLRHLNGLLSQGTATVNEASILCVVILLMAEAISCETVARAAHSKGLQHMVEMFGGEEALSPAVSTHVQLVDIKHAKIERVRPFYPLRQSDQGRFDALSTAIFHSQ